MDREDSWIKEYWRPFMAYQYLIVCIFDFILFPLITMAFSKYMGIEYKPWDPLTLKESGYYHMAMGAVLGVAAWTRGFEKIKRLEMENGEVEVERGRYAQTPTQTPKDPEKPC